MVEHIQKIKYNASIHLHLCSLVHCLLSVPFLLAITSLPWWISLLLAVSLLHLGIPHLLLPRWISCLTPLILWIHLILLRWWWWLLLWLLHLAEIKIIEFVGDHDDRIGHLLGSPIILEHIGHVIHLHNGKYYLNKYISTIGMDTPTWSEQQSQDIS